MYGDYSIELQFQKLSGVDGRCHSREFCVLCIFTKINIFFIYLLVTNIYLDFSYYNYTIYIANDIGINVFEIRIFRQNLIFVGMNWNFANSRLRLARRAITAADYKSKQTPVKLCQCWSAAKVTKHKQL